MQPFLRVESDNLHVTKNSRKFGSKRALSHRRLDATLKAPSELSPRWGGRASPNSGDRPDGRCSADPKPKSAAQQIADGREMPTVPVLPPIGGISDCGYPFGRIAFRTRATSRAVVEEAWLPQLERMKFTTSATS